MNTPDTSVTDRCTDFVHTCQQWCAWKKQYKSTSLTRIHNFSYSSVLAILQQETVHVPLAERINKRHGTEVTPRDRSHAHHPWSPECRRCTAQRRGTRQSQQYRA